MNYIVLAHWIMRKGKKKNKGLILYTDNFTLYEVIILINILILKFNIKPTLHKNKDSKNYRIYINKLDLNKLIPFIIPYFHPIFYYKLNFMKNLKFNVKH